MPRFKCPECGSRDIKVAYYSESFCEVYCNKCGNLWTEDLSLERWIYG